MAETTKWRSGQRLAAIIEALDETGAHDTQLFWTQAHRDHVRRIISQVRLRHGDSHFELKRSADGRIVVRRVL